MSLLDQDVAEQVIDISPRGDHVYILWAADGSALYVGQSRNIFSRLGSHLWDPDKRQHIERVTVIRCATHALMMSTEARLIREHRPPWNKAWSRAAGSDGLPLATVKARAKSEAMSAARHRAALIDAILAAIDAGYSLRAIGDAAGMTHVNILKIVKRAKD